MAAAAPACSCCQWCLLLLLLPAAAASWSGYGSGSFGSWEGSDGFGLPRYVLKPDQDLAKLNGGMLHQLGNDRMIVVALTDGSVAMRQDEGGAKFLNSKSANGSLGQHGGAAGYLSERGTQLLHTVGDKDQEMELGMGYFRRRKHLEGVTVEHSVIAPHGDHSFALIAVNVTNHDTNARTFQWVEAWGRLMREFHTPGRWTPPANQKEVSSARFAAALTHRIQRTGAGDPAPGLLDTVLPPTGGPPQPPVGALFPAAAAHDYNPRPVFLRVIDGGSPPSRVGCNGSTLFPGGAGVDKPDFSGLSCNHTAITGSETVLALEVDIDVSPSSSTIRYFAFGYVPVGSSFAGVVPASFIGKDAAGQAWAQSSEAWRRESVTIAAPEVGSWLERESLWHSFALRAALTYDSYWDGHMLSQNGGYLYESGDNDAMARDPLNHALPLLFYAPQATKGGIRAAIASTHNTHWHGGRIPKATFAFGLGYQSGNEHAKALDRGGWCCYPSDLELWILNAAVRYVLVTRDWAFLVEPVKTTWGEIKTGDALWKITQHLFEVPSSAGGVGLGRHGLLKMLTMDYNDGILLAPTGSLMNVSANNHTAESVLNSAMAVGILRGYGAVLAAAPKPVVASLGGDLTANISYLRQLEAQQQRAVTATWGGHWFARMWAPDSGWFGTEANASIWWSNAFALLAAIPPVDQPAEMQKLVSAIDSGLLHANPTGLPFSNRSAQADYLNSWFAGAMYMLEGLGRRGYGSLAWEAWSKGLLATHATKFPDQLAGIWSAGDHYADAPHLAASGAARAANNASGSCACLGCAGCGGITIFNSWAHTTPLFGVMSLIGAEFTVDGVTIRPSNVGPAETPLKAYNISSPVLSVAKLSAPRLKYQGFYRPMVAGDSGCLVRIVLSASDLHALTNLSVNGQGPIPINGSLKDGDVEIRAAGRCDVRFELS